MKNIEIDRKVGNMNVGELKELLDNYDDELNVYNINFLRIGDEAFIPGSKGIGEIEEEDSICIFSKDEQLGGSYEKK